MSSVKLYISYIGQGIQDDSLIPPSVLVSELMDYLTEGFGFDEKDVLTRHRLQAFSPEYFRKDQEKLFSYAEENMLASTSLIGPKQITPFISKGLTEPDDEWKRISILQLRQFLTHPARYLLQHRLGIYFKRESAVSNDRENFELDALDRYLIGQELVEHGLAGRDLESMLPVYRASGRLPHGSVGDVRFREMGQAADEFTNKVRDVRGESTRKSIEIDLDLACYQIHGKLTDFHRDIGLVRYRFANMKPKDLLTSWIDHLLLGEMESVEYSNRSILICRDAVWKFNPVNAGKEILESILSRYWEGLSKPLPFFPNSSYRYAIEILEKQKGEPDALRAAQNRWQGSDFSRGESEDPYFKRCFGTTDPLDTHFRNLALEIFEPLLGHMSRITDV